MPDPTSDTLDRIHDRIAKAAPSGVWSRADFLDIGTPNAVEKALQRLARRRGQGCAWLTVLWHCPKMTPPRPGKPDR